MSSICLSTAEAEYYALSQAMRVVLPLRALLLEIFTHVHLPKVLLPLDSQFTATVHEDNTSALSLATDQRITSRTRHYNQRKHFFWQAINDAEVEVVYCDTELQDADFLTKGKPSEPFEKNRRRVMGW